MNTFRKHAFLTLIITVSTVASGCVNVKPNNNYDAESVLVKDYDTVALESVKDTPNGPDYTGAVQLTGSSVIWTYDSPVNAEYKALCKMTVTTGKAKLIFIDAENKVTTLIECDASTSSDEPVAFILPATSGVNRIKLVGKDKATVQLSLDLDVGKAHSVDF